MVESFARTSIAAKGALTFVRHMFGDSILRAILALSWRIAEGRPPLEEGTGVLSLSRRGGWSRSRPCRCTAAG